jgi:hypothetical protein
MTLIMTTFSPNAVHQYSDRRAVSLSPFRVVDDETNKMVVVRCQDAMLSIAFAGLGRFRQGRSEQGIDYWLAESLLNSGVAELTANDMVTHVASSATRLFRRLDLSQWNGWSHSFSISGFEFATRRPRFWSVTASAARANIEGSISFSATPASAASGLKVAGVHTTALEEDIRRLQAIGRSANHRNIERAFVAAIRRAATSPLSRRLISKSCTALQIFPSGECQVIHYPETGSPRSTAPSYVWYDGGSNMMVLTPDAYLGSGYAVAFGSPPRLIVTGSGPRIQLPRAGPPIRFAPGTPGKRTPQAKTAGRVHFGVRSAPAKHRLDDEKRKDIELVSTFKIGRAAKRQRSP